MLLSLVYISRATALRSLWIGIARNSQEIVRLSYEFVTPYDLSQRRKQDFGMPNLLAIRLRFLRLHDCLTNSYDTRTNSYDSRANDLRIRNTVNTMLRVSSDRRTAVIRIITTGTWIRTKVVRISATVARQFYLANSYDCREISTN